MLLVVRAPQRNLFQVTQKCLFTTPYGAKYRVQVPIMIYKPEKDWEFRRILIKCDGPHHTYSHLRQAVSMIMAEYSASAGKYKKY